MQDAAKANVLATGGDSQLSGAITAQTVRSGGENNPASTASSGTANATYVFDLFGGALRGQQQANANLTAATYDVGTVRLAFLSSIIGNYIDARYFQESLELTRQTITSRGRTLDLVRSQRDLGAGTDLAVAQAQAAFPYLDGADTQLEAAWAHESREHSPRLLENVRTQASSRARRRGCHEGCSSPALYADHSRLERSARRTSPLLVG